MFKYIVEIFIDFSDAELELLCRCCATHYDRRVRSAALSGGFLHGWLNTRAVGVEYLTCSYEQLGICGKALEAALPSRVADDLRDAILEVLKSLDAQTEAINRP